MGVNHARPFTRLGAWLDDNWIGAGLAICSVLFVLSGLALNSENLEQFVDSSHHATIKRWAARVMYLLLVPGLILWIANSRRVKGISALEQQIQGLSKDKQLLADNVGRLIDGYLLNLASAKLNFGVRDGCDDRVSLFSHDEDAGQFVLVGRYSDNPIFHKTKRRFQYPDTQGCLARAWQNGSDFANDFPNPSDSIDDYAARQEFYGFPGDEARSLTMKSSLYYAYRIMDTRNRNPIAAVVVESTAADRFTRDELDQVFNNQDRVFMSDLLEILQPHLTLPSDAAKAGF